MQDEANVNWFELPKRVRSLDIEEIAHEVLTIGKEQLEPRTFSEALNRPEASKWQEAANEEYSSLIKSGTWKLTALPENRKAISNRWIFKRKYDQDGNISRYKARLVVRGFSQVAGQDYFEAFAPVIKFTTVRIVLALVAQLTLECHQMDVKTAYLNGEVEEELYMEQPDGFVRKGQENLVCKLEKSLYGLKQSAKNWNALDKVLKGFGFVQSEADPNLYILKKANKFVYLLVYVDDLLLASNSQSMLSEVKEPSIWKI